MRSKAVYGELQSRVMKLEAVWDRGMGAKTGRRAGLDHPRCAREQNPRKRARATLQPGDCGIGNLFHAFQG